MEEAKRILDEALREGAEEAAVKIVRTREVMVKIANNEPSVVQRWRRIIFSVYISRSKRISVVEGETGSIEEAVNLVRKGVKNVSRLVELPFYAPLPEPQKPSYTAVKDDKIVDAMRDPSTLTELLIEAAHRERIDNVAGMLKLQETSKVLVTSKNGFFTEENTGLEAYLRVFSGEGSGQWALGSSTLDPKELEAMALKASEYAVESRNPSPIEAGTYDIVLSPMVFGNILNYLGWMASGFMVLMGASIFMKHGQGSKVASEKLTILDAPHENRLPSSTGFDDEGLATRSKAIIRNGVVNNLLHNTKTAMAFKTESTGNAGWIQPHAWNLVVDPGDYSEEELLQEVKHGILVTNNWYTRLQNYVEGLFSTITRDALFLIENGEIKHPIEKVRIADKLPTLLNNIDGIGRRTYNIMWWEVKIPSKLPYILVRNINISKHML